MTFYKFPAEKNMNCPVYLFASKEIYDEIEKTALNQLLNASTLPGVLAVAGMPDLHQGYGLPIGGVMAAARNGPISPGAVGFDINCGVRLLKTGLKASEIKDKNIVLRRLQQAIPAGVGEGSKLNFSEKEFKEVLADGVKKLIESGYVSRKAAANCEDNGNFKEADPDTVSREAIRRGIEQLNTLGSGNHFVELQEVVSVSDSNELEEGDLMVMVHTGSRGFGHQVATDYINLAKKVKGKYGLSFPTGNLAYFPWDSKEGRDYLGAMGAAANFAYANRTFLTETIRKIFSELYPDSNIELFYDHTHNIAREEKHVVNGKEMDLLVHRKGATRLEPGGKALIPGSMGTGSYIVKSTDSENTRLSLNSTAHGAGRKMSRTQAKKSISRQDHLRSLGDVKVVSAGKNILDESPLAYKDITEVISSLKISDLAYPFAQLKPILCIKG